MNWFQILTLVIQELPAIETAALDTVQFITALVHTASNSAASPALVASMAAIKAKSAPKAPVAPTPGAPATTAAPVQPTLTPFKA